MMTLCSKCGSTYDDEFRTTICPHEAFLANDGQNNFRVHHESPLTPPLKKESDDATFDSGAKRSTVMPYYCAVPYTSLRRVALRATGAPRGAVLADPDTGFTYEGGSRKYGYGNWSRGLPMEDSLNHAIDHLLRWKTSIQNGEVPKDDDLAAAAWGILLPLMTFEAEYAWQFTFRNELIDKYGWTDPVKIDEEVKKVRKAYMLQPLAPEEPK